MIRITVASHPGTRCRVIMPRSGCTAMVTVAAAVPRSTIRARGRSNARVSARSVMVAVLVGDEVLASWCRRRQVRRTGRGGEVGPVAELDEHRDEQVVQV